MMEQVQPNDLEECLDVKFIAEICKVLLYH